MGEHLRKSSDYFSLNYKKVKTFCQFTEE